jgi:glycosyltransferase involved in cell wall biosynthesis
MNPLRVSIVIPCLNGSKTIVRLIHSLQRQILPQGTRLEIIVVDNGSTDGTPDLIEELPVRLVREGVRGPAAARNAGVRASSGEVIIFLDADTRASSEKLVLEHLRTLDLSPHIGIAGGAISPDPEQKSLVAFAENMTALFNWHDRTPSRFLSFQPFGNLAFRREVFERVGPLDEGLLFLEDFEWNSRVRGLGYNIYFNAHAGVYLNGRESLWEALKKFYAWGLNIRETYVPGREQQVWLFKNRPHLFLVNVPIRILNESYVTVKRWVRVRPVKTLCLLPLFLLFRSAWGLGIMTGARQFYRRGNESLGKERGRQP